jgi:hypothetical protein
MLTLEAGTILYISLAGCFPGVSRSPAAQELVAQTGRPSGRIAQIAQHRVRKVGSLKTMNLSSLN